MMEKELNKQQMDELIRDWTEELLPPEMDEHIADNLLDFVDNDDTELDVKDLLDFHIHQLAMEERVTLRSNWKILVASVAAASVAVLVIATTFIITQENDQHTDKVTIADPNSRVSHLSRAQGNIGAEPYFFSDSTENRQIGAEEKIPPATHANTKMIAKTALNSGRKRIREERTMKQNEETPELVLAETLAEIKAGFISMTDNTKESLNMTNESLLPVNLTSDYLEHNIIETNLINALYEIRNLNIELNFETDNKTTEI